jgi:hypothetical protein
MLCPVYRRRDSHSGSHTELENLAGDGKGKSTSGRTVRPSSGMPAKGYKLGVQASSDHASTHLAYTCVIAEDSTREALIDAMRKRHT